MAVQLTDDQLQQLIQSVLANGKGTSADASANSSKKSIANCSARFNGSRSHEDVEEFIHGVQTYKDIENISDEAAIKGISLLFEGLASIWWQGVKKDAKTWEDVIDLIRTHFSPKKQPWQIYLDIFKVKQADDVAVDTFICEKRALLAQLPDGRHDEETQLDFIYGMLNIKYRKRITRDEVKTFKELLDKCRLLEVTE